MESSEHIGLHVGKNSRLREFAPLFICRVKTLPSVPTSSHLAPGRAERDDLQPLECSLLSRVPRAAVAENPRDCSPLRLLSCGARCSAAQQGPQCADWRSLEFMNKPLEDDSLILKLLFCLVLFKSIHC